MLVTTLIENTKTDERIGLTAEHGLSLHISLGQETILFDTGASGALSDNAERLGIDLPHVDAAVLSHHHYDHGGGLHRFFSLNHNATVYLKRPPEGACYFKDSPKYERFIGLDSEILKTHRGRFTYVEQTTEILTGVYIFPKIGNTRPKPKGNSRLYIKKGTTWSVDPFEHELAMAVRENDTLSIFTGCAHNGLLNIIDTISATFGRIPIRLVIGGFHLVTIPKSTSTADSENDIRNIAATIDQYLVGMVYTGHCTSDKAYDILKSVLGEKMQRLHTGSVLQI